MWSQVKSKIICPPRFRHNPPLSMCLFTLQVEIDEMNCLIRQKEEADKRDEMMRRKAERLQHGDLDMCVCLESSINQKNYSTHWQYSMQYSKNNYNTLSSFINCR